MGHLPRARCHPQAQPTTQPPRPGRSRSPRPSPAPLSRHGAPSGGRSAPADLSRQPSFVFGRPSRDSRGVRSWHALCQTALSPILRVPRRQLIPAIMGLLDLRCLRDPYQPRWGRVSAAENSFPATTESRGRSASSSIGLPNEFVRDARYDRLLSCAWARRVCCTTHSAGWVDSGTADLLGVALRGQVAWESLTG